MKRTVAVLAAFMMTVPLIAAAPGGVRGTILGVDGRPASGLQVVLVAADGETAASGGTDLRGRYRIAPVPPGDYGLGVISADGEAAPLAAPPTRVAPGRETVRDIRLLEAGNLPARLAPAAGGPGVWWAGLSRQKKIWTVVATLAGTGLLYGATQDDQAAVEPPVTPFRID